MARAVSELDLHHSDVDLAMGSLNPRTRHPIVWDPASFSIEVTFDPASGEPAVAVEHVVEAGGGGAPVKSADLDAEMSRLLRDGNTEQFVEAVKQIAESHTSVVRAREISVPGVPVKLRPRGVCLLYHQEPVRGSEWSVLLAAEGDGLTLKLEPPVVASQSSLALLCGSGGDTQALVMAAAKVEEINGTRSVVDSLATIEHKVAGFSRNRNLRRVVDAWGELAFYCHVGEEHAAAVVHRIPLSEKAALEGIVQAFRRQIVFNTLLESCFGMSSLDLVETPASPKSPPRSPDGMSLPALPTQVEVRTSKFTTLVQNSLVLGITFTHKGGNQRSFQIIVGPDGAIAVAPDSLEAKYLASLLTVSHSIPASLRFFLEHFP
jgi:hypothetical protein